MQSRAGGNAPILEGPVGEHVEDLDAVLADGRFDESDFGQGTVSSEFVLTVLVPEFDRAQETARRWFGLYKTFKAPLRPHRVTVDGVAELRVDDESETYTHAVRSIGYDPSAGLLTVDCAPAFTILLKVAPDARVVVTRAPAAGFLEYRKVGMAETDLGEL